MTTNYEIMDGPAAGTAVAAENAAAAVKAAVGETHAPTTVRDTSTGKTHTIIALDEV